MHEHRARALSPTHPVLRGTAQNPDVFFQSREAANRFHEGGARGRHRRHGPVRRTHRAAVPAVRLRRPPEGRTGDGDDGLGMRGGRRGRGGARRVRRARRVGEGPPVPSLLGSGVRSTRCRRAPKPIAVLDRTKEPGAQGEPLYQDVVTALAEDAAGSGTTRFGVRRPRVIGGRYGLSSKEFTPAMARAALDELAVDEPLPHFTVGIADDVTHLSLRVDETFDTESARTRARRGVRARQRRHRQRQQELRQDHRRTHRAPRTGLLRLRLEEGRERHRLPPPVRARSHPFDLPDPQRQLRRLSSVRTSRAHRRARGGRGRGNLPVEQPVRTRRGLGRAALRRARDDRAQAPAVVRGRRLPGGEGSRSRDADQYRAADLLLRPRGGPADRRGDPRDQRRHREHLRRPRRNDRQSELRRRGRRPRGAGRSQRADDDRATTPGTGR